MQEVITKQNGNIAFVEETHKYFDVTNPDAVFTSVTTMIHSYTQPFDKDFWSAYKALEKLLPKDAWNIEKKSLLNTKKFDKVLLELHGINENDFNREQQGILDEWDNENRKSCDRGTKIHADLENSFYSKKKDISLSKFEIGGKFECRKDYSELDIENGVYPEYLISRVSEDGKLRIAGQIDLLVKKGNKIIIADWKTNKKIDTKSYFNNKTKTSVKMKFPLNNLDDVNYWHYTLQLSTYAWMIQKLNPEFEIEDLVLVHFDHSDNMTVYHLPYLKEEVIKMLNHFKKETALKINKAVENIVAKGKVLTPDLGGKAKTIEMTEAIVKEVIQLLNITTFLDANSCRLDKPVYYSIDRGIRYNSRDILGIISHLGRKLMNLGIKKGDRVIIYLNNSPEYLFSFLALWRIGAVAVPTNRIYTIP